MSGHGQDLGYSAFKIFVVLFVATALEVFWGYTFRDPRWFLWSGLLIFALVKGVLIFMYFMHMKFERFLVWSLIVPTPALILVVICALMPDLSYNSQRDHPVGHMLDENGQIVDAMSTSPAHGDEDAEH